MLAHYIFSLQWKYKHLMIKKMFKMLNYFFFFLQQNTSSLWSIHEPFYIYLLQGSRVNADEGMKVKLLFCLLVCLFIFICILLVGCKLCYLASQVWQVVRGEIMNTVVMWPWPHISHNSSEAVKWNIKTGSGEWLSGFTALSWA